MKPTFVRLLLALLLLGSTMGCRPSDTDDDDTTDDDDSTDDDDWTEPPEAKFDLTYSDPTGVAEWITSGDFSFGFNENGGGAISCIFADPSAGQPSRCDSLAGDANLASPGYGRSWQMSFRDELHSNRYNPTQAGFRDSWGTPTPLLQGDSCGGPGGRLYVSPYRLPIYSNKKFDWVEHEDVVEDGYTNDNGDTDNDELDESGSSQLDEIRSEWTYSALYEDYSDRVTADVAIIRHAYQADFRHPPDAIRQFSSGGFLDNGNPVLKESAIWLDLAPDEGAPASLQGPQVATPLDLATGIFGYSGRVRWSFGYNNALWIDSSGQWQEGELQDCEEKVEIQIGADQHTELYDGNANSVLGGNPANYAGQSNLPMMLLSSGGTDELTTAQAVGFYLPENDCNANQTVGWHETKGDILYSQDRRGRVVFSGNHRACGNPATKLLWRDPDDLLPDVRGENDQTNVTIRIRTLGMLNPDTAPAGVIERFRLDVRLLFGTPAEILAAVQELEAGLSTQAVNCEVTPTCAD